MTDELPPNWVLTSLGSFCDLVNGRAFKPTEWSDSGLPIIRIQNLRNPDAPHNRFSGTPHQRHLVKDGDLLFAWSGTPGTSFGAHVWSGGDAVLNQHIFKVEFDDGIADARFLRTAINAGLPALVKQAKGGAGLKHLTRSAVENIPVPLPPRAEQDRIVSALGATAGRLAAVDAETASLILRASTIEHQVLAAVVEGTLPASPGQAEEDDDPAGRGPAAHAIGDVGEVAVGRQRSPRVHEGPSMRPYLRVANVLDDRIDAGDVMSMNFEADEFERYRLEPGDVLLNEGQSLELVGRSAMYRGDPPDVCFTNTLIRFRAGPSVDPEYALLVFRAYQRMGRFREIAKTTTNLAHLGLRRFAQLDFPLRSLERQKELARVGRNLLERIADTTHALAVLRGEARELIGRFEAAALAGRLSEQYASESARVPTSSVERKRGRSRQTRGTRSASSVERRSTDMPTIPIVEALARSGTALDPQALFDAAGYPEDASVLLVEQFFMELRSALEQGFVVRTSVGLFASPGVPN